MHSVSTDQRLSAMETGLNAPETVSEIGTLLAPFGFDAALINQGKQLLAEAKDLVNQQKVEYGEQYEATEVVQQAWQAARAKYTPTVTLARVALKNDTAAQTALALSGKRKKSLSGWTEQASTFYANLLGNPAWVGGLAKYNRGQTILEAEKATIQILVDANSQQEKEKGEAQEATRARDEKLEELYDWYSDYRHVAEVALAGHPEWIELIRQGEVD